MADRKDIIRDWYKSIAANQSSSVFDDAFHEAKTNIFPSLISDVANGNLVSSKEGVEGLQQVVAKSMNQYESKHTQSKTAKWLRSFSQRVLVYEDVLDVLVQQHPEYVSLVWGTMKLLFIGVANHEATIRKLAKTLSKVADTLPRVKLTTILYPTDRMRAIVTELNTYILRFLIRAHAWYQEGSWKHIMHSFTRPPELRYDDLIEAIAEKSRAIDQLATSCQQAEFRDVHEKLNAIGDKMDTMFGVMNNKLEEMATSLKFHRDLSASDSFSWLSAFRDFFQRLSTRSTSAYVKVLLVTYGPGLPLSVSQNEHSEFVITANVDSSRKRRRGTQSDGVKRLGHQIKGGNREAIRKSISYARKNT
ncbi:hypothetical protein O1611_g2901 [Lasiodiplodia mahajangana]|uniref:Uncharacterized protein n=1 Tax=Lasiodiplodia mahajangana TaxID=1108764 RepID=A0ACC2JTR6_9PEZI|nr:hypothetical protein O1611_g2901 [Lasiodiplodia mahajangana]